MTRLLPSSLRNRFLVVLASALCPLAIAGWWLNASGARSAEELLASQLELATAALAQQAERNWTDVRGELLLLAGNEVAVRTLRAPAHATGPDSLYMQELLASVRARVPSARYRASNGATVWEPRERGARAADSLDARRAPVAYFPVSVPVVAADGDTVGSVEARLDIERTLGLGQRAVGVFDATVAVIDATSGVDLLGTDPPPQSRTSSRFENAGTVWRAAHRALPRMGLELVVTAPTTSYTAPFRSSARIGLLALAAVLLVVTLTSVVVTNRLTTSLADLATTATAIANGDLDRPAQAGGGAEVDRVAESFNAMTQRLRTTIAELSHRQSLSAVGQFAAALSHEVRNALTAVRVDLQRAQERLAPSHAATPIVNRALEQALRLDNAITGALRVARAARLERAPVDMRAVVRDAVRAAEPTLSARDVGLSVRNETDVRVSGDAIALQQLLLNLILNAAQASAAGSEVQIDAAEANGLLTLTVADAGCGVAPENASRVMEPFFSTKVDGTGLGLSIARQIAISHGGTLELMSEHGQGTRVSISLPTVAA